VTAYRLEIVTSGIPEPLYTEHFDAPSGFAAIVTARDFTKELVGNPEEERGELYAGDEHVATIDVSRDEEDAR
jgi:ribosome maturation factor RimP